jgi:hypothetical protein
MLILGKNGSIISVRATSHVRPKDPAGSNTHLSVVWPSKSIWASTDEECLPRQMHLKWCVWFMVWTSLERNQEDFINIPYIDVSRWYRIHMTCGNINTNLLVHTITMLQEKGRKTNFHKYHVIANVCMRHERNKHIVYCNKNTTNVERLTPRVYYLSCPCSDWPSMVVSSLIVPFPSDSFLLISSSVAGDCGWCKWSMWYA